MIIFVGAGKTTTFNILTGDLSMTSGTGIIAGYDIRTSLRDVSKKKKNRQQTCDIIFIVCLNNVV